MLLESKLSRKCLQLRADGIVDALGLAELSSEYTVYVTQSPTEQLYSFSKKQNPSVHLAIQGGVLVAGNGPLDPSAQFRAHLVAPNCMALECVGEPNAFIGQFNQ